MTEDPNVEELFKTSLVTFETLHALHAAMSVEDVEKKPLGERVERLRLGILKAALVCDVDLAGPEYRFLTPEKCLCWDNLKPVGWIHPNCPLHKATCDHVGSLETAEGQTGLRCGRCGERLH